MLNLLLEDKCIDSSVRNQACIQKQNSIFLAHPLRTWMKNQWSQTETLGFKFKFFFPL